MFMSLDEVIFHKHRTHFIINTNLTKLYFDTLTPYEDSYTNKRYLLRV